MGVFPVGIYLYAELQDPEANGHAYALHSEVVDARIAELQAEDSQLSYEDAQDMAQGEALALARIQEGWPDTWAEGGDYMESFLTPPLPVDYTFERRWEDAMPTLPGNAGGSEESSAAGPSDSSQTVDSATIDVTPGDTSGR